MRCPYLALGLFSSMILVSGCGPGISPVKGVVTWNGSPVEGATVTLISEGKETEAMLATGFTDANGNFDLRSGNLEGVKSGNYKVLVTKTENVADKLDDAAKEDPTKAMQQFSKMAPKGENKLAGGGGSGKAGMPGGAMMMMMGKGMPGMTGAPKVTHLLPEKYAKAESTPLKIEVPVKEQPVKLDLSGEAPKKKK